MIPYFEVSRAKKKADWEGSDTNCVLGLIDWLILPWLDTDFDVWDRFREPFWHPSVVFILKMTSCQKIWFKGPNWIMKGKGAGIVFCDEKLFQLNWTTCLSSSGRIKSFTNSSKVKVYPRHNWTIGMNFYHPSTCLSNKVHCFRTKLVSRSLSGLVQNLPKRQSNKEIIPNKKYAFSSILNCVDLSLFARCFCLTFNCLACAKIEKF